MANAKKIENTANRFSLDKKDLLILQCIQQNARATVKEIANKVNLSTTPVHERIKKMEEAGIIKQYAALLDASKIGRGLMAICYVSLKQHSKIGGAKFIQTVQEMNEVTECYSISGEFDFMLKVMVENMDAYYDFHVNKLSQAENIGHVQSIFVMGVVKQTHLLIN